MSEYYGMDGKPISMEEWAALFKKPRHIGDDYLPNGYRVSTVWLGLDHAYGGKPLIFESMVFRCKLQTKDIDSADMDCNRYSTLKEAKDGHKILVAMWRKKKRVSQKEIRARLKAKKDQTRQLHKMARNLRTGKGL